MLGGYLFVTLFEAELPSNILIYHPLQLLADNCSSFNTSQKTTPSKKIVKKLEKNLENVKLTSKS